MEGLGLKMRCRVEFVWTPGHEGVDGNERVDEEAKQEETPVRQRTPEHPPTETPPGQYLSNTATAVEESEEAVARRVGHFTKIQPRQSDRRHSTLR